MKLISLGPRFAAELRGVDLIDVATNDAAYLRSARSVRGTLRNRVSQSGNKR